MSAKEKAKDAIREYLGTEMYWCGRDHSAWSYGTMGLDDFSLASEDEDIVESLYACVAEAFAEKES